MHKIFAYLPHINIVFQMLNASYDIMQVINIEIFEAI